MPPLTLFLSEDATNLLRNKFVVIIGDSIQRGIYKDLIALLQGNEYLSANDLKKKGELSFMNDVLLEGGNLGKMTNGINYREVRQYRTDFHLVRFYFVTRVYNKYWEKVILPDLEGEPVPDVVIINSCLWDISRYSKARMIEPYKHNLETLFSRLNSILPLETLILWNMALPVAPKIKGGFLLPELEYMSETIRLDVLESNYYAKELAKCYDIDVLDLHFFFRHQMHRQVGDGTHWNYVAHRRITNLLLAHIAVSWGVGCPRGRVPPTPPRAPPGNASLRQPLAESNGVNIDLLDASVQKSQVPVERHDPASESPSRIQDSNRGQYADSSDGNSEAYEDCRKRDRDSQESDETYEPANADSMEILLRETRLRQEDKLNRNVDRVWDNKPKMPIHVLVSRPSSSGDGRRSPVERDRPPSRTSSSEPDLPQDGHRVNRPPSRSGRMTPPRTGRQTPSLEGGGLPSDVTIAPIDVGDVHRQSPPSPISHTTSRQKSRAPRAGNRYQPYSSSSVLHAPPSSSYPYQRPQYSYQPNNYPQPNQYCPPLYRNTYHQSYPPYQQHNPYQPGYVGMNYDQTARIRQRIAAERNMEIVRGLLIENVLRLQ